MTHRIIEAKGRVRRRLGSPRSYLSCACGSLLRPIVPRSGVLRCVESGVIAGAVTFRSVLSPDRGGYWILRLLPRIHPPRGLGQMDLFSAGGG